MHVPPSAKIKTKQNPNGLNPCVRLGQTFLPSCLPPSFRSSSRWGEAGRVPLRSTDSAPFLRMLPASAPDIAKKVGNHPPKNTAPCTGSAMTWPHLLAVPTELCRLRRRNPRPLGSRPSPKGSGLVVFYYNRTVGVRRGWGAPCGMGLGEGSASPAVCR